MTPRGEIKKAVLAQILAVMEQADHAGVDTWEAAKRAFPGTPTDVIAEAWVELENAKTEAWWRQVEQMIDGEIVKRAMQIGGGCVMTATAETIQPEAEPGKALDQGFMTEVQASGRLCPHQRLIWAQLRDEAGCWSTTGSVAFNVAKVERSDSRIPVATCLGSRCMSWRWSPNGEGGFCGLAGRPI